MTDVNIFVGTFRQASLLKNHFVSIHAHSKEEAQALMMRYFGPDWSMLYETEEAAGVKQFNLTWYGFIAQDGVGLSYSAPEEEVRR